METIHLRQVRERSHCPEGRAAALLARVTDLPRSALRETILRLPDEEREQLDRLAGEILDDARAYRTFASYR